MNPQKTFADCVGPTGEEGVLLYNPAYKIMQFCDGEKWISAAGGISQNHLSHGVSPWEDMDLTDTADFDGACEYRFDIGSGWAYAHTVHPDYLLFDASTAGWKFGAIEKGTKDQYWHRDDGNVAATGGSPMPIAGMQKSCMIDAEPDAVTFVDVADAAPDTQITSNVVTLSGFNSEVFMTIDGDGAPELSIDGGPWVTSGTVTNDQTVQLRLTSDSGFETARTATVILGGANYSWSVITGPEPSDCTSTTINWSPGCSATSGAITHGETKSVNNSASGYAGTRDLSCNDGTISQSGGSCTGTDSTPNAFSFTDQTNQQLNTLRTSNTITVSGLTTGASVSVSGSGSPQISIDGGGWTTSGTITNGQTLAVRLTSANAFLTARSATVDVGGATTAWSVTTRAAVNCSNTTMRWTNASSGPCQAASGSMTHGQSKSVNNSASGYSGSRDLSCDDGTISQSGGSCATTGGTWKSLAPDYSWNGCGSSVPTPGTPCSPIGKKCTGHNGSTVRSFRCQ
ncbi:protein of unknown function [Candidatus Filomicrobium marinum]|uniref:Uncharacterized protein n=1 Tax=Candidatus Filomicrobium marinum TaxID=1608628 RepID=A0A0D6JEZ6_9HYPH|nr:hypothetical protein [Candidatus Filomicrobium marinum]CFX24052.1 protein of unknown function [Candidatus Filomicrobium marinum]CPR19121.1 protein of unknown function [Candidatus Filomicrobium marinum]